LSLADAARILFLFGGRPREVVSRTQQLARHFADTVPVVYAPYRSAREWLDREHEMPVWQPLAGHPRIEMLPTPRAIFLGRRSHLAGAVAGAAVARSIRGYLKRNGLALADVLFFTCLPVAEQVARHFPGARLHYDCVDDHQRWHGNSARMERLNRENERALVARAQTITATSLALEAKMRQQHFCVTRVPNGVDFELFARPRPGHQMPGELRELPRPLIGFIGAAGGYVDPGIVDAASRANVGSLVFVGPLGSLERELRGRANIHFLGRRPYETLPDYLHSVDVAIIPANRRPASVAANPGKFFQYLASGKPVVATDLPEFLPFRDLIQVAATPAEFVEGIRAALSDPLERRAERQKLARAADWKARAAEILRLMRNPGCGAA
jgi:glycosyltransferase involved in cell wall biosynthesis